MSFGITALVAGVVASFATGALALVAAGVSVVASVLYQNKLAKDAKAAKDAAADAAKGFQTTFSGEATSLPVVYGRAVLGGVRVWAKTFNSYTSTSTPGGTVFQQGLGGSVGGNRHEYLALQIVLCVGEINRCWRVEVNELNSQDGKYAHGQKIIFYPKGGTACQTISALDSLRSSAKFMDAAYVSAIFKLNRDEPQYNGIPSLKFFIEGIKVRPIILNNGVYSLSSTKSFSTNPALCLLDYLLDTVYGKGLLLDDIDLESFYIAASVCDQPITTNTATVYNDGAKALKLFELSVVLDTKNSIRDNVQAILNSMGDASLIWSAGKFRLRLTYPEASSTSVKKGYLVQEGAHVYKALVDNPSTVPAYGDASWERVSVIVTDDNIIPNDTVGSIWPSAQERLNHVKVTYLNQAEGFKEDSVEWPSRGSVPYTTYRAEDNNLTLSRDENVGFVTDYYHALAYAETLVRNSRHFVTTKISVTLDFWRIEPGDYIHLNSEVLNIPGELYKVIAFEVDPKGFISLDLVKFDARILAWNAKDDEVIAPRNVYEVRLPQAENLKFVQSRLVTADSVGHLSWTPPDDIRVQSYNVYATTTPIFMITADTPWILLGTTRSSVFPVGNIPAGSYVLAVASVDKNGVPSSAYNTATGDNWPKVSVGLATYLGQNTSMYAVSVYTANNNPPVTPVGGTFNFETLTLTPPANWHIVPPLSLSPMYRSDAVIRAEDNGGILWSAPYPVVFSGTYVEFDKPVVSVIRDDNGFNVGYTDAFSKLSVILSGADVTNSCTYAISDSNNVTAYVTPQGLVTITKLIGDSGFVTIRITYNGIDYFKTLSVIIFSPGYIVDLTPPPIPTLDSDTWGVSPNSAIASVFNIFIEHDVPQFTEGHGYYQTHVYLSKTPVFGEYIQEMVFSGALGDIGSDAGQEWYIWLKWETRDRVLGESAGPFVVRTGEDIGSLIDTLAGKYDNISDAPFFQLDAPEEIGGVLIPAGTYIKSGYIHNGQITNAKIANLAVDSAKIVDGAITNAKIANIIQSADYVAGSKGWKIDKSGQMEMNNATFRGTLDIKSAASGERMEIKNNVIKIYDANNIVRVQLGNLNI
jgi:hypothetical protein